MVYMRDLIDAILQYSLVVLVSYIRLYVVFKITQNTCNFLLTKNYEKRKKTFEKILWSTIQTRRDDACKCIESRNIMKNALWAVARSVQFSCCQVWINNVWIEWFMVFSKHGVPVFFLTCKILVLSSIIKLYRYEGVMSFTQLTKNNTYLFPILHDRGSRKISIR